MSPHKQAFLDAIARAVPGTKVVCVADHGLTDERKALGWSVDMAGEFETVIAPPRALLTQLAQDRPQESLHVFSGIRWLPTLVHGLEEVRNSGARLGILSEPRCREGWKGAVRFAQSWLTEGWLRRNASFVLAIGRNGPPWFRSVGYPDAKIFHFAYFVDPPAALHAPRVPPTGRVPLRIGYVGRLVAAKGIFDLVHALPLVAEQTIFAVAGTGPDEDRLMRLCSKLGVRMELNGVLPNSVIGDFVGNLDVLVLASTSDDGWGVVVSEALMSGTVVIASSCVGASMLLDESLFGRMVPPRSPQAIAAAVSLLSESGAFDGATRSRRMRLARARLSAKAGADNFLSVADWVVAGGEKPARFDEIGVLAEDTDSP